MGLNRSYNLPDKQFLRMTPKKSRIGRLEHNISAFSTDLEYLIIFFLLSNVSALAKLSTRTKLLFIYNVYPTCVNFMRQCHVGI